MPERIQLRRTKGWRIPKNTVVVTRGPGKKWGNPFDWREWLENAPRDFLQTPEEVERWAREQCIDEFDGWIRGHVKEPSYPAPPDVAPLRGKNLACWCKPSAYCHADVLLELANSPAPELSNPKGGGETC